MNNYPVSLNVYRISPGAPIVNSRVDYIVNSGLKTATNI